MIAVTTAVAALALTSYTAKLEGEPARIHVVADDGKGTPASWRADVAGRRRNVARGRGEVPGGRKNVAGTRDHCTRWRGKVTPSRGTVAGDLGDPT